MIFGLDWDGCTENDIELFRAFVTLLKQRGHQVHVVTMRYPSERYGGGNKSAIPDDFAALVDGVVFTSRQAKLPAMIARGIKVDVWIDDNPRAINESAEQIWGWCTPEGVVISSEEEAQAFIRSKTLQANA